jgi:hypothetical protein
MIRYEYIVRSVLGNFQSIAASIGLNQVYVRKTSRLPSAAMNCHELHKLQRKEETFAEPLRSIH